MDIFIVFSLELVNMSNTSLNILSHESEFQGPYPEV